APGALDERHVLARLHIARAHEHHVLKKMRESREARALVAGTNVVPDVDGYYLRRIVLGENYAKPVGELIRLQLQSRRILGGGTCGGSGKEQQQGGQSHGIEVWRSIAPPGRSIHANSAVP